MIKRITAIIAILCIVFCLLSACGKTVSGNEAYHIALEHIGVEESEAGSPHIHEGKYNGVECYNIYVTVGETDYVYYVSKAGRILGAGEGTHNH